MDPSPSIEDLRLVGAVERTGSVGAAARELRVAQPSASQRLTRLERRCGTMLFERDTRGARPTAAGREMARQAHHILGHLEGVYGAVCAAAETRPLTVGTFPSLAEALFPVLDEALAAVPLDPRADHGDRLVDWVAEGTMDAAFVGIAEQMTLPRGVVARRLGDDRLVLFLPVGSTPPAGVRQPLRGRDVVFATYDNGSEEIRHRLIRLGATPRRAATVPVALATARRRGHPAAAPRSAVATLLLPGETYVELPFRYRLRLSMVTGTTADPRLLDVLPTLRAGLGFAP